ncbi:hypothetical protein V495_02999 [Pseudogymnoascus sp. VKM F-4514 (FW-929)]|nr:hypothetical protein V495_02999 [Pseudogymnoascus sp. VKM F-4514 (FW-929)]KFY56388.1 hypothetical protein V497_06312 [Pseudogymnoascus sp. VKM F-4516 (FW-969)]
MDTHKDQFTAEDFNKALVLLDKEIEHSTNLRKILPITLLAKISTTSSTLKSKTKRRFKKNYTTLSRSSPEWANNNVAQFAVGDTRVPLFQESLAQNVVLWKGKNLVIYAVKWEWSLARKLKRIGSTNREIDISDAVATLYELNKRNGAPLKRSVAKSWDEIVFSPIEDHVLDEVARRYKEQHGQDGMV